MHLKQFERALEAFEHSNSISRHDSTFLNMGKVPGINSSVVELPASEVGCFFSRAVLRSNSSLDDAE